MTSRLTFDMSYSVFPSKNRIGKKKKEKKKRCVGGEEMSNLDKISMCLVAVLTALPLLTLGQCA